MKRLHATDLRTVLIAALLGLGTVGLSACDEGPIEEAGEEIDAAASDNPVEEAGDEIEDAAENAQDAVEDSTD